MDNNVKLTTKLEFQFEDPDDFPEINLDIIKTIKKTKHKIIEHKRKKKEKVIDASTKLF